jgi:hypothetical protein
LHFGNKLSGVLEKIGVKSVDQLTESQGKYLLGVKDISTLKTYSTTPEKGLGYRADSGQRLHGYFDPQEIMAVVQFLSPRFGAKVANLDAIMKKFGGARLANYKVKSILKQGRDALEKMPIADQINFIDRIKTGKQQSTPELQGYADIIRLLDDQMIRGINETVLGEDLSKQLSHLSNDSFNDFAERLRNGMPQWEPANPENSVDESKGLQAIADTIDDSVINKLVTVKQDHFRVMWKVLPKLKPKELLESGGDLKIGEVVKASDRDNFGHVTGYDPGTKVYTVHFKGPKGEATVELPADTLSKATTEEVEKSYSPRQAKQFFMARSPLEGTKGFKYHGSLSDMSEGIARGGQPVSYNPMVLFETAYADAQKFISTGKLIAWSKNHGAMTFVKDQRPQLPIPEGKTEVNDKLFNVWLTPPKGTDGMLHKGTWYMDEDMARLLNNHLSKDWIRATSLGRGALAVKNFTTAIELAISPFHAITETGVAIASQFSQGLQRLTNLGIRQGNISSVGRGLADIATSPLAPVKMAITGGKAIKYLSNIDLAKKDPNWAAILKEFPAANDLLTEGFDSGMIMGQNDDFRINAYRNMKEAFRTHHIGTGLLNVIPAIAQEAMKPLFDIYIPRLKIATFLTEYSMAKIDYSDELDSGEMTAGQLGRKIWDSVENRFGEMNFDNLFWNRTLKSSLQLAFRSVTWKLGNVRMYGNAIAGQGKDIYDALNYDKNAMWGDKPPSASGTKQYIPRLNRDMSMLLGIAAVATLMSAIVTKLTTKKYPWELAMEGKGSDADKRNELLKNIAYPRTDANDASKRVSSPTYLRDGVSLAHSPGGYIWSSTSGVIGKALEDMQNKDYFNNQVWDPQGTYAEKAWQQFKNLMPKPFSVSSFQNAWQSDEPIGKAMLPFAAFTKAPGWVTDTAAWTEVKKIRTESGNSFITPYAKVAAKQENNKLIADIRAGKVKVPDVVAMVKAGKMDVKVANAIWERATTPPLVLAIKNMSSDQIMRVWDKATEDEKDLLRDVVNHKLDSDLNKTAPGSAEESAIFKLGREVNNDTKGK